MAKVRSLKKMRDMTFEDRMAMCSESWQKRMRKLKERAKKKYADQNG